MPAAYVGRAMSDVQRMAGTVSPPETAGSDVVLTGSAPVANMRDYAAEVAAYTRGQGRLFCTLKGYEVCHNPDEVIEAIGYNSEQDLDNPADSVFCSHGAGFVVKWDQVREHMHLEGFDWNAPGQTQASAAHIPQAVVYSGGLEQDKELQTIFERTYGAIKPRSIRPRSEREAAGAAELWPVPPRDERPEFLLVDGYNIIFAWDELKDLAKDNLDAARQVLMDLLSNYQGFHKCEVILVFDAYKVPGGLGEVSRYHNIYVVYTKEAETADAYIEKATYEIAKKYRVRVATSDAAEQLIILGHGALRVSARAFQEEIGFTNRQIREILTENNRHRRTLTVKAAMDKALEKT